MLYNAALVLEGGAMRGQYSTGITDAFLAHHIEFRSVIGVSAGALCGVQYVAKQYGRMVHVNTHYRKDKDYISFRHLFKHQDILNLDFLFQDHGWDWHNLDERAYQRSASNFTIVATQVSSGRTVTFEKPTGQELEDDLKASCSMPFIMEPQMTSKGACLDGGVADSIPYDVAQAQGYDKIVIVRTRPRDYRKKPSSRLVRQVYHRTFKDAPRFAEVGIQRPEMYNRQVEMVNKMTDQGKWFTFSPENMVKVGRLENNTDKLAELYHQGQQQAEELLPLLTDYLAK
ncbi:patatin-like phospholipase family protein [Limosilactobacillus caecicola]|uniref:patatin-like phospholipase family protein n=1 Tax=Limosilactobacillus caecicola TaxID=2941332 RepID=UPI0020405E34|nr:patatin family protein [Limosilactobacillus caecicola]